MFSRSLLTRTTSTSTVQRGEINWQGLSSYLLKGTCAGIGNSVYFISWRFSFSLRLLSAILFHTLLKTSFLLALDTCSEFRGFLGLYLSRTSSCSIRCCSSSVRFGRRIHFFPLVLGFILVVSDGSAVVFGVYTGVVR